MGNYTDATAVYLKSGLSATEIDLTAGAQIITDAESEMEMLTGRKFTNSNSMTEYINGPKKDILGYTGTKAKSINVSNWPVLTITSFLSLNVDGTTNTDYGAWTGIVAEGDYETDEYWVDTMEDSLTQTISPYGKLTLKNTEFVPGTRNIKIVYTYGYATVPNNVKALASCLAGMRAWVAFMGGQYNRIDSYSVPEQTVSKGDFTSRANSAIDNLKKEADMLLDRIGRRPRTLFYSTGGDR